MNEYFRVLCHVFVLILGLFLFISHNWIGPLNDIQKKKFRVVGALLVLASLLEFVGDLKKLNH
jgi:hypothetical protein